MSGPSREAECPGAGAGCPGWQGPASVVGRRIFGRGGRMSGASERAGCPGHGAGCPGCAGPFRCSLDSRCRISGARAGCPTRARCPGHGRMSGCCSSRLFFLLLPLLPRTLGLGPWALHGLLGCTCVCTRSTLEVASMSYMRKGKIRKGASSPCVQWSLFEVSSYVHLGLGQKL